MSYSFKTRDGATVNPNSPYYYRYQGEKEINISATKCVLDMDKNIDISQCFASQEALLSIGEKGDIGKIQLNDYQKNIIDISNKPRVPTYPLPDFYKQLNSLVASEVLQDPIPDYEPSLEEGWNPSTSKTGNWVFSEDWGDKEVKIGWFPINFIENIFCDYKVLDYIRENWKDQRKSDRFAEYLNSIWETRIGQEIDWNNLAKDMSSLIGYTFFQYHMRYNPGDYSRAAIMEFVSHTENISKYKEWMG